MLTHTRSDRRKLFTMYVNHRATEVGGATRGGDEMQSAGYNLCAARGGVPWPYYREDAGLVLQRVRWGAAVGLCVLAHSLIRGAAGDYTANVLSERAASAYDVPVAMVRPLRAHSSLHA